MQLLLLVLHCHVTLTNNRVKRLWAKGFHEARMKQRQDIYILVTGWNCAKPE